MYIRHKLQEESVQITAADFNGHSFDGSPFTSLPDWLKQAIDSEEVAIHPDDRDYALWSVNTPKGKMIAEPGDSIIRTTKGLFVRKDPSNLPHVRESRDWVIPPKLQFVITRAVLAEVMRQARSGHATNNVVQSDKRNWTTAQTDVSYALNQIAKQIHADGTIRCYRTMNVDSSWMRPITNARSLGIFWTYNENFTMGDSGEGTHIMLVADVPIQSIDWVDTILLAMDNVEDEIRLISGAPVQLVYIEPEVPISHFDHFA
jgi:hypothetical protein